MERDIRERLEKNKIAEKKLDEEKLKRLNITDVDAWVIKHKDGSKKLPYNRHAVII